jgi:predicted 3-demethylubiquinone-9 3-methyltransferase (glyoxalase superfamily)
VQTITPFLWFDDQAEEAARFYVGTFANSEILGVNRAGGGVMSVSFVIDGLRLEAFNGGPAHPFTEAISLFVPTESQAEIDRLWDRLLEGGGRPDQCGWLKDQWGLSWQIVPTVLMRLLGDPDPERSGRAMQAMLGMVKLDIAALQAAADGIAQPAG